MGDNVNAVESRKESKIRKFFTSEGVKKFVQIGTTVLTLANTIFLLWTCASSVEAEVNADVMDEYYELKKGEMVPVSEEVVNS